MMLENIEINHLTMTDWILIKHIFENVLSNIKTNVIAKHVDYIISTIAKSMQIEIIHTTIYWLKGFYHCIFNKYYITYAGPNCKY
jgi:hypothetical protein